MRNAGSKQRMKIGTGLFFSVAILKAITGCSAAPASPCDEFLGHFSVRPGEETGLKFEKDLTGYLVHVQADQPGEWERIRLETGFEPEVEAEMIRA